MIGNWSWIEMCGPAGLVPWYPSKRDIGSCFQQIFILVPVLIMFAVVSAYYYGSRSDRRRRISNQKCIIQLRCTIALMIAIVPLIRILVGAKYYSGMFRPVDYLIAGTEVIVWFVHSGYVLSLRHMNKLKGPVVVMVLWILLFILSIINLRTQTLTSESENNVYNIKLGFCITLVVLQTCYGLTLLNCKQREQSNTAVQRRYSHFNEQSHLLGSSVYQSFREDIDQGYLGVAMENESFLSKLIFYWVYALVKKGSEKKLANCDDLYDLPAELDSSHLCRKLHNALGSTQKLEEPRTYGTADVTVLPKLEKVTLLKALHKCFGVEFYLVGILKLFSDILNFGGPLLLNRLMKFFLNKNESSEVGYLCAFGLFATTLLGALANVHFNFQIAKLGLKLRGSVIGAIYTKTINTKYLDINSFSIGEITNFMATDTERIVNSCASFHSFWSIPLQIIVTFYLLYMQVRLAFLAGVIFTVILVPINKVIASKIGELSIQLMKQKDLRVSSTAEMLLGIRVLKFHVWEQYFLEKILKIRKVEVKHLKARKYLDALCVYFWATTPILISILTFATYYLMGNQLDASTVFTTMALLNMLIAPLNAFPWILNGLTEAWISIERVQRLLDAKDNNFREYFDSNFTGEKIVYSLKHCSFQWQNDDNQDDVDDNKHTDSSFNKKESLKTSGDSSNIEYTSAQPQSFLVNETEARCSWEIEYQTPRNKHFVLDNINLTIHEGNLVGVIGPVGSGKSTLLAALIGELKKTRGTISMRNIEGGCALVTQTPWIQRGTFRENVLFGKSYDNTWYKNVLEACCLGPDLEILPGGDLARIGEGGMTLSGGQKARLALARAVYQNKDIYLLDDVLASVDVQVARVIYNSVICGLLKNKTRILCTNQIQFLTNADLIVKLNNGKVVAVGKPGEVLCDFVEFSNIDVESIPSKKSIEIDGENIKFPVETDVEETKTGEISGKVYSKYWTSVGHCLALIVLFSVLLMQVTRNLTDYWLSIWVSQETNSSQNSIHANNSMWTSLNIYIALAVMNTFVTLLRAFLFAYSGIQAAVVIHEKLLKKVLSSTMVFFDISPLGRILNRFSNDTYVIDDILPFILNIFLAQIFGLFGSIVLITYGLPWLILVLASVAPVYFHILVTYRCTSRELRRLSSITLSPLMSHFNETLQGLTTIRAFRCLTRFKQTNEDFLECSQKSIFASQAANQWLNFQLQMIGVVLITSVSVIATLQHEFDVVDSSLVGLIISYALTITSLLSGVVSAFTETEKEMISLERVGQYIDEIETEPEVGNSPPYGWPSQGVIVFYGVYLKYREHIPPSLNGISFETRPAEKVGVVGRTGAGKSSLIVALLRLVNICNGKILIDAVNINQISLQALRSRISVIPQDPFLFEGSVRINIDPLDEYSDTEILSALKKCYMKDVIERLGGLSTKICSGGRNFSQGERQLLCLARAVLRNAKIVCVDEATAFVDPESDKKIQHTLRSSFRQSTVLTIAHRLSTVMDCDRILVLNDGEVVEFDTPKTLALDESSYFYQLRQQDFQ